MTGTDPAQTIIDLSTAYWASRCLHLAAEFGVADALGDEPKSAAELAADVGADAQALHRLLRALANHGIFELRDGRFAHNACSRLLCSNGEGSLRLCASWMGMAAHWNAYGALDHSLKTGRPAVEQVIEEADFFSYLRGHPREARIFAGAMATKSRREIGSITASYDFTQFETIGDIGGNFGQLLEAVLDTAPGARGLLFDLPQIVEQAKTRSHNRVHYVGGDFFKDRIPSCDAYLLMMVLHDWSDAEAIEILQNIRRSAPAHAKYLIIEGVMEAETGDVLIDIDIEMMALTTGRERSRTEWEKLLRGAGLEPTRIIAVGPGCALIESSLAKVSRLERSSETDLAEPALVGT